MSHPLFFFIVIFYNTKFRTWAFSLAIVKILAFTILKHYFYSFNISFYNMLDIKTSIFFTTSFKNYFFYNFLFLFCFYFFSSSFWSHYFSLSLSISLSLPLSLSVSLSQPNNHTHHRPLATTILTTTTTIKDPHWSSRWPTSLRPIKLMIHAG